MFVKQFLKPEQDFFVTLPSILQSSRKKSSNSARVEEVSSFLKRRKTLSRSVDKVDCQEKLDVLYLDTWSLTPEQSPRKTFKQDMNKTFHQFTLLSSSKQETLSTELSPFYNPVSIERNLIKQQGNSQRVHKSVIDQFKDLGKQMQSTKNEHQVEKQSKIQFNKQLESELKEQAQQLKRQIEEQKQAYNELKDMLQSKRQEMHTIKQSYQKELDYIAKAEQQLNKQKRWNQMFNNQQVKVIADSEWFKMRSQIFTHKSQIESDMNFELQTPTEQIKYLKQKLSNQKLFVKDTEKEISKVQNSLLKLYYSIINQGIDTREIGIRWAIKEIWLLQQEVPISIFPNYLDNESVQFLFSAAQKDIEIVEYQLRLKKIRNKIIKRRLILPKETFNRFNNIHERIRRLTQKSVQNNIEDQKQVPLLSQISWVKDNLHRLRLQLSQMYETEISRVTDLHNKNLYRANQQAQLIEILSTLLGNGEIIPS